MSHHSQGSRRNKQKSKGHTRIPHNEIEREALVEMGYVFMEEEVTGAFIITPMLSKSQIDELIEISEQARRKGV
jgi:hypothetical protein